MFCAVCQLKRDDIRVGQTLRVCTSYAHSAERRLASRTRETWRWFYLTEDNHWAPLAANDTATLQAAYERGWTSTWIGQRDHNPSLVRLDKMCMYNEITGHGRPVRRRKVEWEVLVPGLIAPNTPPSLQRQASSGSNSTPLPSLLPAPTFPPDDSDLQEPPSAVEQLSDALRRLVPDIEAMGFPTSHCARALAATGGNPEAAVSWIFAHQNELLAQDRKDDAGRKERAKKREERKRAREEYSKHKSEMEKKEVLMREKEAAAAAAAASAAATAASASAAAAASSAASKEKEPEAAGGAQSDNALLPARQLNSVESGAEAIRFSGRTGEVIKLDMV
jgi:hypothetical protein